MRECEGEGEISLPRPRTLAFSTLAFFKNQFSDTFGVSYGVSFMLKPRVFIFK